MTQTIAPRVLAAATTDASPAIGRRVVDPARPWFVQLRQELETITARILDPAGRRAACLDAVLRQRRLTGGAWFALNGERPQPMLERLAGPALDRPETRQWLARVADQLRTDSGPIVAPSPEIRNLSAVAMGLPSDGGMREGVILLAANITAAAEGEMLALQQLAGAWEAAQCRERIAAAEDQTRLTAALIELTERLTAATSLRTACQELVRAVQEYLGCGLAAVGLCANPAALPRLAALSDSAEFDSHSGPVQRIEAALAETCIAGCVTGYPVVDAANGPPALAHKRLTEILGCESVLSTPLTDADGRMIGGLLCLGPANVVLNQRTQRFLHGSAQAVGVTLAAARRHEGGWLLRVGRTIAAGATRLRTALAVIALAGIAAGLALSMPYRISAGCTVEPTERRLSLAPFEGLLATTHVAPGDVVVAGQVLATMDGRELQWELTGVVADQERAAQERDTAMASHDVAKSYMAALEVERLAARETLLRDRIARLRVRSPLSGIVLAGGLDRRENVPVKIGQSLYEIAPLDRVRLELEVPADDISHVRVGQPVEVRLHGDAAVPVVGTIARVRPGSEVRHGRNVFIAEVEADNLDGRLRPGMEGSGRITGDVHPLGWNLFHRPWEYLTTRLW